MSDIRRSRFWGAAAVTAVAGAALLASAAGAVTAAPTGAHATHVEAAAATSTIGNAVKISVGEADLVSVVNGEPSYHGKTLKPRQTLTNNGIYIHYSIDGKRLYTNTGEDGAHYAIWNTKTGTSLGSQQESPT